MVELGAPFIIIGLGNPGTQYEKSRHNAGFSVIDSFIQLYPPEEVKQRSHYWLAKCRINDKLFYLIKPLTFMNLSGIIINDLRRKIGMTCNNLVVVADNMDLLNGRMRLKNAGGSAGQKGLKSIIEHLGSNTFCRLYIGIGHPTPPISVANYVLGRFLGDDEDLFLDTCEVAASFIALLGRLPLCEIKQQCNSYA